MGTTKSVWENGVYTQYDSTTFERRPIGPLALYEDDFLTGSVVIPAAGAAESGCEWVKKITGAGPPTVAVLTGAASAVGAGGVLRCALTATDEKQEGGAYWNDQRPFTLNRGLIFEARINPAVLPTGTGEMWIGLGGAYVEGTILTDGPAEHALFVMDGSGAIVIYTDDTSTDNDGVATGVTLTAGTYAILRIDATDPASVKFYINGARVAGSTTFVMSAVTTLHLQPYVWCHKESGTGLGTLDADYVRIWQKRAAV
ncbi:MAG: hypothetical protein Q7T05_03300 [Dehalococcoidia bacterium]|nr:hypothetical protein [Dehalococcoidia bacterium]